MYDWIYHWLWVLVKLSFSFNEALFTYWKKALGSFSFTSFLDMIDICTFRAWLYRSLSLTIEVYTKSKIRLIKTFGGHFQEYIWTCSCKWLKKLLSHFSFLVPEKQSIFEISIRKAIQFNCSSLFYSVLLPLLLSLVFFISYRTLEKIVKILWPFF